MEHIFTLKERLHSSIPPENNGRKLLGPLKLREIFRYQKDQWKKLTRLYAVISNFSRFFLWKKRWKKNSTSFLRGIFHRVGKNSVLFYRYSPDILLRNTKCKRSFTYVRHFEFISMAKICASAVQKYAPYLRVCCAEICCIFSPI